MRIIHIIDSFQPKLGYQETFLAREHSALGHDVYVVTSDRYYRDLYNSNRGLLGKRIIGSGFFKEFGINVCRLKVLFEMPPREFWLIGLEKKIEELRPDIVIVHGIANFSAIRIGRMLKKKKSFKLIFDDHMTFYNSTSKMKVLYPLFKLLFMPSIKSSADAFVAAGDSTKPFMNVKYGIPLDKITNIPLGVDLKVFRFDINARNIIRNELSFKDGDIIFIYTGKIIPSKRIEILIGAMNYLIKYGNVKILIVGDGQVSYIDNLIKIIKSNHLDDRFFWHSPVPNEELYKFYSAADIAIWPSGASISQREAMACSLPIILNEDSLVLKLLDFNNGYACKEGDAIDMARKMEALINEELRKNMGINSRRAAEENLDWRKLSKKFIDLCS